MRVGILDCFTREHPLIVNREPVSDKFARLLSEANSRFEFSDVDAINQALPDSVDSFDAYIITGSLNGAYDQEAWILKLGEFIQECFAKRIKLLGICFGHQIIAHFLGGQTAKSPLGPIRGLKEIECCASADWMSPKVQSFHVYKTHGDQVIKLPPDATLLAQTPNCPVAMYSIRDQVFCLQGHPEFEKEFFKDLMHYHKSRNGFPNSAKICEDALESVKDRDPDRELIANWMADFLTYQP